MKIGRLEPMSKMTTAEMKETMLQGCDMIDEFLKRLERPIINATVAGKSFARIADVPLLGQPCRRRVEVLVQAGGKWWRQQRIEAGVTTAKIHVGDERTKQGTKFPVIAITTERPLDKQTYANLPDHRTKSKEITLVRA